MAKTIGLIVNPIAGMGGRVGLKGTDNVVDEAVKRGAKPQAPAKSIEMLTEFVHLCPKDVEITWLTCSGKMGADELNQVGINVKKIVYHPTLERTCADDTKNACKKFLGEQVDLILFCGGDGTARDIVDIIGKEVPILGIPAGVKMHSGVFGITIGATAKTLCSFVSGQLTLGDVEIMDIDEEQYRKGEWCIKLFGIAKGIVEPTYVQVGKAYFESLSDEDIKEELAEHIHDEMERYSDYLFLLGSGGTIDYIAKKLNLPNTLLGIDAVYQWKTIKKDLNEQDILSLLQTYSKVKLILSPIGAQGFILGRGNLQLSPKVIQNIGLDHIIVISTPSKLVATPVIRVDTGDKTLDRLFRKKEFWMVVIGYRLSRVVTIQK